MKLSYILSILFIALLFSCTVPSIQISPTAVYTSDSSETTSTPTWQISQVSCEEKPAFMWRLPGTYLFESMNDGGSKRLVIDQTSESESTWLPWNKYFKTLPVPLGSEPVGDTGSLPGGYTSVVVSNVEKKTTSWGKVQAVRVDINAEYDTFTGRLDSVEGRESYRQWYVCGLGLVQSTSSSTGTKNQHNFHSESELVLLSFTPVTTNESRVRYLLVDIQLGSLFKQYRSNITDEETAEAVRRWNAGIRVENIDNFERKIVNGQWQIVYTSTQNQIRGMDVVLTID